MQVERTLNLGLKLPSPCIYLADSPSSLKAKLRSHCLQEESLKLSQSASAPGDASTHPSAHTPRDAGTSAVTTSFCIDPYWQTVRLLNCWLLFVSVCLCCICLCVCVCMNVKEVIYLYMYTYMWKYIYVYILTLGVLGGVVSIIL